MWAKLGDVRCLCFEVIVGMCNKRTIYVYFVTYESEEIFFYEIRIILYNEKHIMTYWSRAISFRRNVKSNFNRNLSI